MHVPGGSHLSSGAGITAIYLWKMMLYLQNHRILTPLLKMWGVLPHLYCHNIHVPVGYRLSAGAETTAARDH